MLLLRHEPSGIPIDLSLGALAFEENAVRRAVPTDAGGFFVPLARPEDLVVMKAVAHRPVDAADIDAILAAHPRIDRAFVLSTVREFAEAIEAPELLDDLAELLHRRTPTAPGKKKGERGGKSRRRG